MFVMSLADERTPPMQNRFRTCGFHMACTAANRIGTTVFLMKRVKMEKFGRKLTLNMFPLWSYSGYWPGVSFCPQLYTSLPLPNSCYSAFSPTDTISEDVFSPCVQNSLRKLSFVSCALSSKRSLLLKHDVFIPLWHFGKFRSSSAELRIWCCRCFGIVQKNGTEHTLS